MVHATACLKSYKLNKLLSFDCAAVWIIYGAPGIKFDLQQLPALEILNSHLCWGNAYPY